LHVKAGRRPFIYFEGSEKMSASSTVSFRTMNFDNVSHILYTIYTTQGHKRKLVVAKGNKEQKRTAKPLA
jgi:hypothetical protein